MNRIQVLRDSVVKITQLLSGKGIQVTQRGVGAYVLADDNGKPYLVNLPYVGDDASEELISAIQGFLDHEVAHILFTEFSIMKEAKKENVGQLTNILEDAFIEKKMAKKFKGSAHNLNVVGEFYITKVLSEELTKEDDESKQAMIAIVPLLRAFAGQTLYQQWIRQESAKYPVIAKFASLFGHLQSEIENASSTRENFEIALKIKEILEENSDSCSDDDGDDEGDGEGGKSTSKRKKAKFKEKDSDTDGEISSIGDKDEKDEKQGKDDSEDEEGSESKPKKKKKERKESGKESEDSSDKEGSSEGEDSESSENDAEGSEDSDGDGESESKGETEDEGSDESDSGNDEGDGASEKDGDDSIVEEEDEEEYDDSSSGGDGDEDDKEPKSTINVIESFQDFEEGIKDSQEAIADVITISNVEASKALPYLVYTTDYDRVAISDYRHRDAPEHVRILEETVNSMTGVIQKNLERAISAKSYSVMIPGQRKGRIHAAALSRLTTGDDRVFRRKEIHTSKDVAVQLVVDLSGSMAGYKINLAVTASYALCKVLDRLNISNEVIGFTTRVGTIYTGEDERRMRDDQLNLGRRYTRVEPLEVRVFKEFEERFTIKPKERLSSFYDPSYYSGGKMHNNIDGECIEIGYKRLIKRPEAGKIMIVLSDGYPACFGDNAALDRHLKKVVEDISKKINVIGIGIKSDAVEKYYPSHVVLEDIESLPLTVIQEMKMLIMKHAR